MLIVLLIFCLFIFIGALYIFDKFGNHDCIAVVSSIVGFFSAIAILMILIGMLKCLTDISTSLTIDRKIDMYQRENKSIEKEVAEVVNSYKDFEKEVVTNTGEMATILIKFPELKSNELVSKQIQIYVDNNNKIKELKEKKIDYSISKFWLYFGK